MNLPHPSQISCSDNDSSPTSDMIQEQGYVDFGIDSAESNPVHIRLSSPES